MIKYPSIFLSHSSKDKPLVEAVAKQLVRRGIHVWLDKHELPTGTNLMETLRRAVESQKYLILFLSEKAINSTWVTEELKLALELEESFKDKVIPVYLGDPLALVKSQDLLRKRWLHPDGGQVSKLGIVQKEELSIEENAINIAKLVSIRVFDDYKIDKASEVIICIDQRKDGRRFGLPDIPDNLKALDAVCLTFRPDLGEATRGETVIREEWYALTNDILSGLREAFKGVFWKDTKKIRLVGHSQLAIPFLIGTFFNRNSNANLYCYGSRGEIFTNNTINGALPLDGGNENCETPHSNINEIGENDKIEKVALILASESFVIDCIDHAESLGLRNKVWKKNEYFQDSEEVINYVKDVIALITKLKNKNRLQSLYIYGSLPFAVLPILAASLHRLIPEIKFVEYRTDLVNTGIVAIEDKYTALSINV